MKLSDALSREELRGLSQTSDGRGAFMLGGNLLVLAIAFGLAAWQPVLSLLSIILIAGQQLAFAIIMHDCAHKALFRTGWLNEFTGKWIGGAAIDAPFLAYRDYHLEHHKHAGTDQDPDQGLVKDYPVSRASLARKFRRDLTGQTGLRELIQSWRSPSWAAKTPFLAFQIVLFGTLIAAGAAWTYGLWWVARLLLLPAIMRLRNIGEHGVAMDRYDADPRRNTHTTRARWWEIFVVAPNNVNFHLEHHMFAGVPPYNLPRLHETLRSRGYYDGFACTSEGYADMLAKAVRD